MANSIANKLRTFFIAQRISNQGYPEFMPKRWLTGYKFFLNKPKVSKIQQQNETRNCNPIKKSFKQTYRVQMSDHTQLQDTNE